MEYTETERRILDMWPKFEDGEYVWIGDDVSGMDVRSFVFTESGAMVTNLTSVPAYGEYRKYGEPFKRPAPKVLDADGVLIKVGDTVWFRSLSTGDRMRKATVTGFGEHSLDGPLATLEDEAGKTWHIDPKKITHVQPDSWERLEEDAEKGNCEYLGRSQSSCDGCYLNGKSACDEYVRIDLVRRAKALAEKEASR